MQLDFPFTTVVAQPYLLLFCRGGGADGSVLAFNKTENAFHANGGIDEITDGQFPFFLKSGLSAGDFVHLAAAVGTANCPGAPRLEFMFGRPPPKAPAPDFTVPEPTDSVTKILERFADAGFSPQEAIALLSSHTIAAAHRWDLVSKRDSFMAKAYAYGTNSDTQVFLEVLLKGRLFPGNGSQPGEVLSPLAGEMRLQSDFRLSQDPRTACFWQAMVNNQERMVTEFKAAMAKLQVLGQDRSKLIDCSDVVPIPKPFKSNIKFPPTFSRKDVQIACPLLPFPNLATQAGPAPTIPPVCVTFLVYERVGAGPAMPKDSNIDGHPPRPGSQSGRHYRRKSFAAMSEYYKHRPKIQYSMVPQCFTDEDTVACLNSPEGSIRSVKQVNLAKRASDWGKARLFDAAATARSRQRLGMETSEDKHFISMLSGLSLNDLRDDRRDSEMEVDGVPSLESLSLSTTEDRDVTVPLVTSYKKERNSTRRARQASVALRTREGPYRMPGPDFCQWEECGAPLRKGTHRLIDHFPDYEWSGEEIHCQWTDCDDLFLGTKRAMALILSSYSTSIQFAPVLTPQHFAAQYDMEMAAEESSTQNMRLISEIQQIADSVQKLRLGKDSDTDKGTHAKTK
ncbi:Versatile peroxidase VPL1 [Psilocybe cubensis]|uniref:Versatile peroxidase VPL1 n=2 Tax=Psilocybe cubensis TaxID=181762 RepID=A0ACB8GYR8_PSICU|nr:Versatile peroxidase VPL1 [Psilocybe cubensis]KAH9480888.1 Versatile peroxidase VPL1 [Psilocybe cubensis]